MIRDAAGEGWDLITHRAHARLAGKIAQHWKTDFFEPPMPFAHILDAVTHHDDSWVPRDNNPRITGEGLPSAFSSSLVGTYEAFEEVELGTYLRLREEATEKARKRDSYAAVLISMHTVNLLTDQADLTALDSQQRDLHREFVESQRATQAQLKTAIRKRSPLNEYASDDAFQRAFEFLQACDSLSLYICVDYDEDTDLRHKHPRTQGDAVSIAYERRGPRTYSCDPWPFDQEKIELTIPYRHVTQRKFDDTESFRQRYHAAEPVEREFKLVAP